MAMTFARLILEVRRRAASIPADVPRPFALEKAVRELLATDRPFSEIDQPRRVLGALAGIDEGGTFDAATLDSLTPEDVLRIDLILDQAINHGREQDALREIRSGILRSVK